MKQFFVLAWLSLSTATQGFSVTGAHFKTGIEAESAGEFERAAAEFQASAAEQPAAGTLLNLGLAEWQRGRVGEAVLSWEQARWLDPFDPAARNNLLFARQAAQLEAPELAWYETTSTWLPANTWAWMATVSLWLVVALLVLPKVLRWRKAGWHQSGAAVALGVFLLSLPPNVGVVTRANWGIVREKKTALRMTPTLEAEASVSLTAGEPVRRLRTRGNYFFVRSQHGSGWVERRQLGLLSEAWK